jgi:hypothetical protein
VVLAGLRAGRKAPGQARAAQAPDRPVTALRGTAAATATSPLPTPQEAMLQPMRAFPSWFLRITRDRCGKDRMVNEAHAPQRDRPIRDLIAKMRHDDCGGHAGKAALLTGIEGISSRPVRRIVLRG